MSEETGNVTADAVKPLVVGAVSGDQLDALRAHIGASVVADLEAMLQVHTELSAALAPHLPAPVTNLNAAVEIGQHLDDLEKVVADHGSAGGHDICAIVELIRSKL